MTTGLKLGPPIPEAVKEVQGLLDRIYSENPALTNITIDVWMLASDNPETVIPVLIEYLSDEDMTVRKLVKSILQRLTGIYSAAALAALNLPNTYDKQRSRSSHTLPRLAYLTPTHGAEKGYPLSVRLGSYDETALNSVSKYLDSLGLPGNATNAIRFALLHSALSLPPGDEK